MGKYGTLYKLYGKIWDTLQNMGGLWEILQNMGKMGNMGGVGALLYCTIVLVT